MLGREDSDHTRGMSAMFSLIIFDMDDTLVASTGTWTRSELRLFDLLGHSYDPGIAALYKGMNALDVGRTIHEELKPPHHTADDCARLLRALLVEEFQGPLDAMPGAGVLLQRLHGWFPLALASGSPLEAIHQVLSRFNWTRYFPVVISSESVAHGKPAPDVFLETARLCDVTPAECLVIEDSLHGVRAAKRAGMTCYAIPSSRDARIPQEADGTFARLDEILP